MGEKENYEPVFKTVRMFLTRSGQRVLACGSIGANGRKGAICLDGRQLVLVDIEASYAGPNQRWLPALAGAHDRVEQMDRAYEESVAKAAGEYLDAPRRYDLIRLYVMSEHRVFVRVYKGIGGTYLDSAV
jgi:hypothetical protein